MNAPSESLDAPVLKLECTVREAETNGEEPPWLTELREFRARVAPLTTEPRGPLDGSVSRSP